MSATLASNSSETPRSSDKRFSISRHLVLPPIKNAKPQGEVSATSRANKKKISKMLTPFSLPPGDEVFALREKERLMEREEWANERTLKVHEKGTYSSRLKSMLAGLRKQVMATDSRSAISDGRNAVLHEDVDFVLATTRGRHLQKEDLSNYIYHKREMFLVQYSLGVKKNEIRKLIAIREAEEQKLDAAEQYIELSATVFDEFLKENDKSAVEAIKRAELATKAKLDKVAEIKKLNAHLVAVKNEISRNNDLVAELCTYKNFLDNLTNDEIREQWKAARKMKDNETEVKEKGEEEDAELYFNNPSQLIHVFTELEEQNLSLIQNSQETEVTMEDLRQSKQAVERTMNMELDSLKYQVDLMKLNIEHEEEKAYDLEIKSKMYSYGEYRSEDQEKMLKHLDKKVADVYSKCIEANEASMPTLQMLAAIENRMEELFETMESLPPDKIEAAEKVKEKERRLRMREEKLEEQRSAQEERLRRALERSQADPKKKVGRKLVYRSEPPVLKRKQA